MVDAVVGVFANVALPGIMTLISMLLKSPKKLFYCYSLPAQECKKVIKMNMGDKFGLKSCDNIVVQPFLSSISTNGRFSSPKIPRFSTLHSSPFLIKFKPSTTTTLMKNKEDMIIERQKAQLKRFAKLNNKPNDVEATTTTKKNNSNNTVTSTKKKLSLVNSRSLNELRDYVEHQEGNEGFQPTQEEAEEKACTTNWRSLRNEHKSSIIIAAKSEHQELSAIEDRSGKIESYGVGATTKNWAAMLAALAKGRAPKAKEEDTCTCLSLTPVDEYPGRRSFRSRSIRRLNNNCEAPPPAPLRDKFHKLSIPAGATCQLPVVQVQDYCRKSCPDLLQPCLKITSPRGSARIWDAEKEHSTLDELKSWTLDDVIIWIQSIGLEELNSIFIGYDIAGNDIIRWDDEKLKQMGIKNPTHRRKILIELRNLKQKIIDDSSFGSGRTCSLIPDVPECTCKSDMIGFMTLYDLVKNDRYNRIFAYELSASKISAKYIRLIINSGRSTVLVKEDNFPLKKDD
uniref:SAM domain-containing protein n=1 Tax=Romanomermis culicivorax TaxID=13658 RepID=A0A915JKC4_ROMCU